MNFQGFSNATLDFMWGIRLNNHREWFLQHKQEYLDHLYNPFKALGSDVLELVTQRCPDRGLCLKVTRIYRDARRLHGRDPYKDHLWLSLEVPQENWTGEPVFWFELRPSDFSYGLGFYAPRALTMDKLRKRLDTHPERFLPLAEQIEESKFTLESQLFKRPKKPDCDPRLFDWYNSRGMSVVYGAPNDERLFQPQFAQELADSFCELMPLYDYLATINSDADPR